MRTWEGKICLRRTQPHVLLFPYPPHFLLIQIFPSFLSLPIVPSPLPYCPLCPNLEWAGWLGAVLNQAVRCLALLPSGGDRLLGSGYKAGQDTWWICEFGTA